MSVHISLEIMRDNKIDFLLYRKREGAENIRFFSN